MMWWALAAMTAMTAMAADRGGESAAESTQDLWASMSVLTPEAELIRPLAEPVTFRQGPAMITLDSGYLTPVFSGRFAGDWAENAETILREQRERGQAPRVPSEAERGSKELVGFVWTRGTGSVTVRFPDRADAQVLANRLVRELGVDRAELEAVAHGEAPFTTALSEGVLLGIDPALDDAFAGPELTDPYEIVVFGDKGEANAARRRAKALWDERTEVWDELELDVADKLAWDRVAQLRGVGTPLGTFGISDLHTGMRYGFVVEAGTAVDPSQDRWLAAILDSTGRIDSRRAVRVASLGITPGGRPVNGVISGLLHPALDPSDPTSARVPMVRPVAVRAETRVYANPIPSGWLLEVDVESQLTVRAEGGDLPWIDLLVPKTEAKPGAWKIVAAQLPDGTDLLGVDPTVGGLAKGGRPPEPEPDPDPDPDPRPGPDPRPRPGPEPAPEPVELDPEQRLVRLLLPEPLAQGDQVTVRLRYLDAWPQFSRTSGLQSVLPQLVPGFPGGPWPFTTKIAVPDGANLHVAASGVTTDSWVDETGWRWTEVTGGDTPGLWADVAIGRFKVVYDPPQKGFPGVRTALSSTHWGQIDEFAPETRRVIDYYQRWLPPFPVDEIDIFEAAPRKGGFVWIAPHGMVNVQIGKTDAPTGYSIDEHHLSHRVYAHELAHQYWGHLAPPASREDFWIAETFSELFSCMYVGAAFGPEECAWVMSEAREGWETRDPGPFALASLSRAYSSLRQPAIVYDYGPYVFAEMLRPRLGVEPFFAALDLLLTDHPHEPVTTERLQRYLEGTSGEDLSDFFDFWVHGGFVPHLELTWAVEGDQVVGEVTSDVPFGTFDVAVRAQDTKAKKGEEPATEWARVEVVDGVGRFAMPRPAPTKRLDVVLDPDRRTLSRARKAKQVEGLAAAEGVSTSGSSAR